MTNPHRQLDLDAPICYANIDGKIIRYDVCTFDDEGWDLVYLGTGKICMVDNKRVDNPETYMFWNLPKQYPVRGYFYSVPHYELTVCYGLPTYPNGFYGFLCAPGNTVYHRHDEVKYLNDKATKFAIAARQSYPIYPAYLHLWEVGMMLRKEDNPDES